MGRYSHIQEKGSLQWTGLSILVMGVWWHSVASQGWELQTVNPWLDWGQKVSFLNELVL